MKTIWRVENGNGWGPYRGGVSSIKLQELLDSHDMDEDKHPCPWNDSIGRPPESNEVCGFNSIKQAKKWFTARELQLLESEGYILKEVEVQEITAIGDKQVLAKREGWPKPRHIDW